MSLNKMSANRGQDQYLNVRPQNTRPYTPRANGKAERFIQTNSKEWADNQPYESSAERGEYLIPWLNRSWRLERLGYMSPREYRQAYLIRKAA